MEQVDKSTVCSINPEPGIPVLSIEIVTLIDNILGISMFKFFCIQHSNFVFFVQEFRLYHRSTGTTKPFIYPNTMKSIVVQKNLEILIL